MLSTSTGAHTYPSRRAMLCMLSRVVNAVAQAVSFQLLVACASVETQRIGFMRMKPPLSVSHVASRIPKSIGLIQCTTKKRTANLLTFI